MKITEARLRKLIRKFLLEAPDGLHPTTRDITLGKYKSTAKTKGHYGSEPIAIALIELGISFTPAGFVIDAKDFAIANDNKDGWGMFFAGIGFIPLGGDLVKNAYKLKKLQDVASNVGKLNPSQLSKIKKVKDTSGKIDADDIGEVTDIISSVGSKASRVVRGTEKIKDTLKSVIKDDRTYHVHTVNSPQYSDDVLKNGVALRANRSGYGYRATTHNNDAGVSGAATLDQLRFAPFSLGNDNKLTVIYEVPPGKTLKDIVVDFKGTQRGSQHGEFIGNISNDYLKAYVDRRGAEDIMNVLR